jgi:nucleotide-binding universal stress UspA family protein
MRIALTSLVLIIIATAKAIGAERSVLKLIVVGTHGRSGFEKWLLGSVAEGVCGNAELDVLAVPRP